MKKNAHGSGDVVAWGVDDEGQPWLSVLGRDSRDGRWTSFRIEMSWRAWCGLDESLYRHREDVAQERIADE